ncbi:MAG: hypothetical protein ACE5I1_08805 [bacterium]
MNNNFENTRSHETYSNGTYSGSVESFDDYRKPRWFRRLMKRKAKAKRHRKKSFASKKWRDDPLGNINKILAGLAILFTILSPVYLWYEASATDAFASRARVPQTHSQQMASRQAGQRQPANTAVFARRQYFRIEKQETADALSYPVSASEVPGLAERYTLIGVLTGDDPQAIVRANDSQVSIFVSVGHRLDSYIVKRILPNMIVLEQDGLEVELRM